MATSSLFTFTPEVEYPDSDGQPMAENTLQFQWIVTIQGNLDALFANDPTVFVAGDLLWYPVQGDPKTRTAPDAMVAFGRPKGYRGSYKQWQEGDVAPQVVWEVLSPGNRAGEMKAKFDFYERFGVEEYYLYDPDNLVAKGWIRRGDRLEPIKDLNGWVSPRLKVRFDLSEDELVLFFPDGRRFLTFMELAEERNRQEQRADDEHAARVQAERRAAQARQEKDAALRDKDAAVRKAEELAAKLRSLGIDPDA